MESLDINRSLQLQVGSISTSTSTESLASECDVIDILKQPSMLNQPVPPTCKKLDRQRPCLSYSPLDPVTITPETDTKEEKMNYCEAESTCFQGELKTKADESCFNMDILLDYVTRQEDFNKHLLVEHSTIETQSSLTKKCVKGLIGHENQTSSGTIFSRKEKVHRKKKESERRKNGKVEMTEHSQEDMLMKELSRNRSMFNRNKSTLPAIGTMKTEANMFNSKMPEVKLHEITKGDLQNSNIIDVIRKHEVGVREATHLKEISQDYINSVAVTIESRYKNNTIDIIGRHERENSKMYGILNGNYTVGGQRTENDYYQSPTQSRCSSVASRRGTA